ncbi:DEKNAAC104025 [Brettanomyces naardenensis]|uniref:DEKNAAC104025 n=1 Tax=Brettanomyces naardenensis TaxID=13370 RepID=A0A448YPQ0_BRENA|nr:DEKNAAC104025 [Brettanomyces naardenensis]
MIIIDNVKYACERCIRGHRVSTCNHRDAKLIPIKPKGRPSTQCPHCKELRKMKNAHVSCDCSKKHHPGQSSHDVDCACVVTGDCDCGTKSKSSKSRSTTPSCGEDGYTKEAYANESYSNGAYTPISPNLMQNISSPLASSPLTSDPSISQPPLGLEAIVDPSNDAYDGLASPTGVSEVNGEGGDVGGGIIDPQLEEFLGKDNLQGDLSGVSGDLSGVAGDLSGLPSLATSQRPEFPESTVAGAHFFEEFLASGSHVGIGEFLGQQSGEDLLGSLGIDAAIKSVNDDKLKEEEEKYGYTQ